MAAETALPGPSSHPSVTLSSATSMETGPSGIGISTPSPARKLTSPRMMACCDMAGAPSWMRGAYFSSARRPRAVGLSLDWLPVVCRENAEMQFAARVPRAAWLVLAFALVTGALLAWVLVFLHAEAVRSGEDQTNSLSQVIAEQTTRTLQSVDARLQLAATRLEVLEKSGSLDHASARTLLRAQLKDLPYVRAIWVLGADGHISLDSDDGNIGLDLSDREYFKVYQRVPSTEFFIGPLVRSRTVGSWLLSASRPLRDANGAVRGVITAAVEPGYFE